MGISIEEVRRVAQLAKLEFPDSELQRFTAQLGAILDYVERLRDVDTEGIEPDPGHPTSEATLRTDERIPCLETERALANAPDSAGGYFRVPRVIG